MASKAKNRIIDEIMELLIKLTEEEVTDSQKNKPAEMLTIKECTNVVQASLLPARPSFTISALSVMFSAMRCEVTLFRTILAARS